MTNPNLGARLALRHEQLTRDLVETEAFEALTEVEGANVTAADIRAALARIEAHAEYVAHLAAEAEAAHVAALEAA